MIRLSGWLLAGRPRLRAFALLAVGFCIGFLGWICWPVPADPPSAWGKAVLDEHGRLLRVWRNEDGQFRQPSPDTLDPRYVRSLIAFEDRRFHWHPGVDPIAVMRALRADLSARSSVQGASTIAMQDARLRSPAERNWSAKLREALMALRLRISFGKAGLLRDYSSRAPMGGNIVGVTAACWRYFGHGADRCSWAEAALLAVLPKNPSQINLVRGRVALLERRNGLLHRLASEGAFDSTVLVSALAEPIPDPSRPFPFRAPHFTEAVSAGLAGGSLETSLDLDVQSLTESLARQHLAHVRNSGAHNLAVVVADTRTGLVRAWVGSGDWNDTLSRGRVDGVLAPRSTASTLKPFLYAMALDRGPWTSASLLEDIPTYVGAFAPQNPAGGFDGIVPMEEALARSLNVPAVRLLRDIGVQDFYHFLVQAHLHHLFRGADGYGLSLVLGGAEASLFELTSLYRSLGVGGRFRLLSWNPADTASKGDSLLSTGASWLVREMLTTLHRPEEEENWQWFQGALPVAWKTGTSYGSKDAWAIGTNAQWTIGVWVGNFEGGSVAGMGGAAFAGPLLFRLFDALGDSHAPSWPPPPSDLRPLEVCALSGYPPQDWCPLRKTVFVPAGAAHQRRCPWHERIVVERSSGMRVDNRCWSVEDTLWSIAENWPAAVRERLEQKGWKTLEAPAWKPGCAQLPTGRGLELVYPQPGARIYLAGAGMGAKDTLVAQASAPGRDTLWWFVDGHSAGLSVGVHTKPIRLTPGGHQVVVQDATGAVRGARIIVTGDTQP